MIPLLTLALHLHNPTEPAEHPSLSLLGVSTATWQDSGADNCPNSQWTMWEKQVVPLDNQSHGSAHLFELYQTKEGRQAIISRLQKLHLNSYRFSIEWSHIEPQEGVFLTEMLIPYIELCKDLKDAKIQPMVTLLHFSEPLWFHEKGSFEKEENISFFLNFVHRIYPYLTQEYQGCPLVEYICTINEPAIDAFSRYIYGSFSPGKKLSFTTAATFLLNALEAHARIYRECKSISPKTQIGIVHQRLCFVPTSFLLSPVTHYLNEFLNEASLRFIATGTFSFYLPLFCNIEKTGEKPQADFLGLQYYSRPLLGFSGSTCQDEPMTQMPFREDPKGLYEALVDTYEKCHLPIIITENGISTNDPIQRKRYLAQALNAAYEAQQKIGKENIQGYYLWSFCKNAEWDMGMHPQNFGIYSLDNTGFLSEEPQEGFEPLLFKEKKGE